MLGLFLVLFALTANAAILALDDFNFDSVIGGPRPVFVKFVTTCTK